MTTEPVFAFWLQVLTFSQKSWRMWRPKTVKFQISDGPSWRIWKPYVKTVRRLSQKSWRLWKRKQRDRVFSPFVLLFVLLFVVLDFSLERNRKKETKKLKLTRSPVSTGLSHLNQQPQPTSLDPTHTDPNPNPIANPNSKPWLPQEWPRSRSLSLWR
jgi:hypothetical protein